jgi:hypothetical protein
MVEQYFNRPRQLPSKFSSFNYLPIVRLFESTKSEFLETYWMKIRVSGELLKDGAGYQGSMVKGVD